MNKLKTETRTSNSGGTITEYFDHNGNRQRLVHIAGNAYSGKTAVDVEDSEVPKKRPYKRKNVA